PVHVDWARYRLKLDNSGFNELETTLTRENVGMLRVLWEFRAQGAVWGALAAAGGRVYVGDATGKLSILDDASGALLRTLDLGNNGFFGGAYATPTVIGDILFVQDAAGDLIKYDYGEDRVVWRALVGPDNAG